MRNESLNSPWAQALIAALAGLLLAVPLALWLDGGAFARAWGSSGVLLALSLAVMLIAWRAAGGGRALAAMMLAAFLLRLLLGGFFTAQLTHLGYPANAEHTNGYFFSDAFNRDWQAWILAISGQSIGTAFTQEMVSDQYGGLLSLSALVYRLLSPDTHRQYLMIILGAGAAAFGIPFLWATLKRRWGHGVALLAGWLLALYPESVLLGASQMREPFLISLVAAMFWSVNTYDRRRRAAITVFALSLAGMLLFSARSALMVTGVCAGWFLLERVNRQGDRRGARRAYRLGWIGLGVALLAVVALSYGWLAEAAHWDTKLTVDASGWVQKVTSALPEGLRQPFVVGYGLAQPVFPAALADLLAPWIKSADAVLLKVAPDLIRWVGVLRSLGWYLLAPFMLYVLFAVWGERDPGERRLLVWLALMTLFWMLLSSARAGGDQWDNPRYRTILLPFMALLAGWGWARARALRDAWLRRWALVVGIFVLFFSEWYLSRYTRLFARLDFFVMIGVIAGLSLLVIAGGLLLDRRRRVRQRAND